MTLKRPVESVKPTDVTVPDAAVEVIVMVPGRVDTRILAPADIVIPPVKPLRLDTAAPGPAVSIQVDPFHS